MEVADDVITDAALEYVGKDVPRDYRSNGSRDIRGRAGLMAGVCNCAAAQGPALGKAGSDSRGSLCLERTNEHERGLSHKAETPYWRLGFKRTQTPVITGTLLPSV